MCTGVVPRAVSVPCVLFTMPQVGQQGMVFAEGHEQNPKAEQSMVQAILETHQKQNNRENH